MEESLLWISLAFTYPNSGCGLEYRNSVKDHIMWKIRENERNAENERKWEVSWRVVRNSVFLAAAADRRREPGEAFVFILLLMPSPVLPTPPPGQL